MRQSKLNPILIEGMLLFFIGLGSVLIADERPNIIFLFTDDQSYKAMGCMGNDEIKTPNMDKLGSDGVIFDRHYNTTAICMASRATVMTGLLEYKHGCNFHHGSMTKETFSQSYPVLMRQAGYFTGFAGKFGFPVTAQPTEDVDHHTYELLPVDQFDVWAGGVGQSSYVTAENEYIKNYADKYPHCTRAYGAWAGDFMKQAKASGKPFCLSVFFKAPHTPNRPDPFFDDLYKDVSFSKPANFGQENGQHLALQSKSGRQYLSYHKKFKYFGDKYDEQKRLYYQLVSGVDYAVGMIRKSLEEQGLADNTVIILTSDNGYSEGAHGFSGKVLPYEEPSRAPMIVFDPRSSHNSRRVNTVTAGIDVTVTLLDMAGIAVPEKMDGKSLVPLLNQKLDKVRDYLPLLQVWGTAPTRSLAVVSDEWKYIYWAFADDGQKVTEELFHLGKDPLEMTNLATSPEHQAKLAEMRSNYDAQLQHWNAQAVPYNDYANYAKIFDRTIPWEQKKAMYSEASVKLYYKEKSGKTKRGRKQSDKNSKKDKKSKKDKNSSAGA